MRLNRPFICLVFLSSLLLASHLRANNTNSFRPGDLILISQNCWLCSLIEQEEGAPYSHMGILVPDEKGQWKVLEASGEGVRASDYAPFILKVRSGSTVLVRRFKNEVLARQVSGQRLQIMQLFKQSFSGLSYDPQFLWDNQDSQGQAKYYCSEFVTQFFAQLVAFYFPTKLMHYQQNRQYWEAYFAPAKVPDGLPGNSPADFARSPVFKTVMSW